MERSEKKVLITAAGFAAIGVYAIGGYFYKPHIEGLRSERISSDPLESVLKPEAVHIGHLALNRAEKDHDPYEITPAEGVKNAVRVEIRTSDGVNTYYLDAEMKKVNGTIKPDSTYVAYIEQTFPDTDLTETSAAIIGPPVSPDGRWLGEVETFIQGDTQNPAKHLDTNMGSQKTRKLWARIVTGSAMSLVKHALHLRSVLPGEDIPGSGASA